MILHYLQRLQKVGLSVIEAIIIWRSCLTRPYAFIFKKHNYLLKMLADGHYIDNCDVSFVVPMKLSVTPLLSSFATLGSISISEQYNAPLTYPLNKNKMNTSSDKDPSKCK